MNNHSVKIGLLISGFFLFLISTPTKAQILIDTTYIETSTIAEDLDTPWEIMWGPDDWIWITERYGRVSRANPETGEHQVLTTIDEASENGEGGMLGLTLHPDFQDSAFVYIVYNYYNDQQEYQEKLVRYTFGNGSLINPVTLLDQIDASGIHNGSRLVIDDDYKLYMTTGDASNADQAQDINSINGKVLRMNLDGSIPDDNPIADSYVWSWGHRNSQGLVLHPDGTLYSSEHGPASDDEINIIHKGRNYGWPDVRGFCGGAGESAFCSDSNVVEPLIAWTPTLAVCGLDYYRHDAIGEWNNSLLLTNLKNSSLVALKLDESGEEIIDEQSYFDGTFGRLRDLCISPDGRVFLAVSNRDGRGNPASNDDRIIEIKQTTGPTSVPEISGSGDFKLFPNPVEDMLHIHLDQPARYDRLTIYDQKGRKVWQTRLSAGHQQSFPVGFLSTGVYQLKLSSREHVAYQKLIKK